MKKYVVLLATLCLCSAALAGGDDIVLGTGDMVEVRTELESLAGSGKRDAE